MAIATYNNDYSHTQALLFSVAGHTTSLLSDYRDNTTGCLETILVRVVGELCFAALIIASLVESFVRGLLMFASIPISILLWDSTLTDLFIDSGIFALDNAWNIATGALVQNLFAEKLSLGACSSSTLPTTQFSAEDRHLMDGYAINLAQMVDAQMITIPEINDAIDFATFDSLLTKLGEEYRLFENVDNDGDVLDSSTFMRLCRSNLRVYTLKGVFESSREFAFVVKHLMRMLERRWKMEVAGVETQSAQLQMVKSYLAGNLSLSALSQEQKVAVQCIRDAAKILKKLCVATLHCSNRRSTDGEELYWQFVVNDPTFIEKKTLGYRVRCALVELRNQIFMDAIARVCAMAGSLTDEATTHNYYRRMQAAKYGVPAGISQSDTNHEFAANKGYEFVFERAFAQNYTIAHMVDCLQRRIASPVEKVVTPALFNQWARKQYGGDQAQLLDERDFYTPRVILAFLESEGIIQTRRV